MWQDYTLSAAWSRSDMTRLMGRLKKKKKTDTDDCYTNGIHTAVT